MASQTQPPSKDQQQETQTYKANSHCGQIKYTVDVSPPLEKGHEVMSCNCSICIRDGKWNIYIPKDKIHLVAGEDKIKEYNYLTLAHAFCPDCGTSLYCRLTDPNHEYSNEWALSVRAFYEVDMSKLKFVYADMKNNPPKYDPGW